MGGGSHARQKGEKYKPEKLAINTYINAWNQINTVYLHFCKSHTLKCHYVDIIYTKPENNARKEFCTQVLKRIEIKIENCTLTKISYLTPSANK